MCMAAPFLLPLFTQVPRREVLGTSPISAYRKLASEDVGALPKSKCIYFCGTAP